MGECDAETETPPDTATQFFRARWPGSVLLSTLISLASVLLVAWICVQRWWSSTLMPDGSSWMMGAAVMVLGVLLALFGWFFLAAPRGYAVTRDELHLLRNLGRRRIPLVQVAAVRPLEERELRGAISLCAVKGFCGYFGWYWSRSLGRFRVFATSLKANTVLLELHDGSKFVLSPEEPQRFCSLVSERLFSPADWAGVAIWAGECANPSSED